MTARSAVDQDGRPPAAAPAPAVHARGRGLRRRRSCVLGALAPAGARAVGEGCANAAGISASAVWCLVAGMAVRGVDVARGDRAAVGGHEQRKGKEHRQLSVLWMCLQTQINTEHVEFDGPSGVDRP